MTPLTIGTATFDDLAGTWFTVQSLLLHHREDVQGCEILVIDNQPGGPVSKSLKALSGRAAQVPGVEARYVAAGEVVGTSYPRDRIFREATREAVLCLDSHVLLAPGSIGALRAFYAEHPDCPNLLSGPMLGDHQQVMATHFDDVWSRDMWGVWGHHPAGDDPGAEPFEIAAMGLGLFSSRKDAWPGFNGHHREFGGEEFYIHEKYRQAGARCLCLPAVRWLHYFGVPAAGRHYPLRQWSKVRNYVLEHNELGLSLDRVRRHFVEGRPEKRLDGRPADPPTTTLSVAEWDFLVSDPVAHTEPPGKAKPAPRQGGCGRAAGLVPAHSPPAQGRGRPPQFPVKSLEGLYAQLVVTPSDINEHLPKLRELAAQCDTVIEFGVRTARSSVALLAGQPAVLKSYDRRSSTQVKLLERWRGRTDYQFRQADVLDAEPEECDLLFIDTKHTAAQLTKELDRHVSLCRRWIAMHDTQIFGERGEDGGPGLLVALRGFLREHPEWGVVYRAEHNNGLTVISRVDKRPLPSLAKRAKNFLQHSAEHVLDGGADVSADELQARLDVCSLCPSRSNQHCAECGCPIAKKAKWRSSYCDLGFWPLLEAKPRKGAA